MNKKQKILLIVAAIISIVVLIYFKTYAREKNPIVEYKAINRKNDINEYNVANLTDEDIAIIYLNDYRYYLFNNIEEAYDLLDDDYKKNNFQSINEFKIYVNNLNYSHMQLSSYRINKTKDEINIKTIDGIEYRFIIKSILEYKVSIKE